MALVGLGSPGRDPSSGGAQQRGLWHRLSHGWFSCWDWVSLFHCMWNITKVLLLTDSKSCSTGALSAAEVWRWWSLGSLLVDWMLLAECGICAPGVVSCFWKATWRRSMDLTSPQMGKTGACMPCVGDLSTKLSFQCILDSWQIPRCNWQWWQYLQGMGPPSEEVHLHHSCPSEPGDWGEIWT